MVAKKYTKEQRIERFEKLSGLSSGSTIILASDYVVDVGGIEHYLLDVQELLQEYGYIVHLVGCKDKALATNRFRQLFGTIRNKQAKYLIHQALQDHKPDLLWWHSVQRRMGPAPLYNSYTGKQRVMYHDFGLFHPYPSQVTNEQQVMQSKNIWGYLVAGGGKMLFAFPLLLAKWCSSKRLKYLFTHRVTKHLVPSAYMGTLIKYHYKTSIDVEVLPHFIS